MKAENVWGMPDLTIAAVYDRPFSGCMEYDEWSDGDELSVRHSIIF